MAEKTKDQIIDELRQQVGVLEVELKNTERLARDTKRHFARLMDSSTDAIISADKEGRIVLFSEGAKILLGYQAEEVIGGRMTELYSSEAGANELLREMRKRGGSVAGFESLLRAKDGSDIPVLVSASVLFDAESQEVGTVVFNTDLRARKQNEETLHKAYDELEKRVEERTIELKTSRERFQYLLTVTPGIIYTSKGSGDYACTFVSENVDPIMGFSAWEMLEDPGFWLSRLHPEDAPLVKKEVHPLLDQGGGTLEYRFRNRDGNYIWIQDTFRVIRDDAGRILEVVGAWADISYHKQAEQALGERITIMKDLQTLVAASPSVIYTTTQTSDGFACRFVSENLKPIMGYLPWEMRDNPKFWLKHLHPDDATRVIAQVDELVRKGGGTLEYRFRHRRGDYVWVQDSFSVVLDKDGKPREIVGSWADISDRKQVETELRQLAEQVGLRNRFIRDTFGRYLTDEVVSTLLESPTGLQMGGEKRKITMMMTDLRGFTSLSERLAPERVVTMLNRYLTTMVTIIKRYQGTIDEFIGDAILVLFGAPVWQEDDAQRAVACAVDMQLAMVSINEQNKREDLPDLEMGIGIHTGQVVVGNIGSQERMKYGVVGSHVNLTSRIQSFTTGGQVLISETTRKEAGPILKFGKQIEVKAKGIEDAVTVSEVLGIGRPYKLYLTETTTDVLIPLVEEIPFTYEIIEASHLGRESHKGNLTKLSPKGAEARLENSLPTFSNFKMHLLDTEGREVPGAVYGKVVGTVPVGQMLFSIRFTSVSPEIETLLRGLLATAAAAEVERSGAKKRKRPRRTASADARSLH